MNFDIQYLLLLQELRNATGGIFDEFFNSISKIAVDVMPFLPYVIFWAFDKKWGYRFLYALLGGDLVNATVKLTVCAYRPWIRSSLIEPAGDSKVAATGYSFPSGHTLHGTTLYGTTLIWQKDKRKWLAICCAFAIFLTGFSRNFLGVHTPQDVVVGFLIGCLSIFLVSRIANALSGNDALLDKLTFLGFAFVAAGLAFVTLKSYPMDYVDGVLLVDPNTMMNDHFKVSGAFTGLLLGSYLDRHYVHYEIPFHSKNLALLTGVGLCIVHSWKSFLAPATIVAAFGEHWGNFLARFLMLMFIIYIWPVCITKWAD